MAYPRKKPSNYDKLGKRGYGQVELILTGKLKKKFCPMGKNPEIELFIEQAVQKLLKDPRKLNAQKMIKFESEMSAIIQKKFLDEPVRSRPITQASNQSGRDESPTFLMEERLGTASSAANSMAPKYQVDTDKDEWGMIVGFMQKLSLQEEEKAHEKEKEKKVWMKKELDKQMKEKKMKTETNKKLEDGYYDVFMQNLNEHDEKERKKLLEQRDKDAKTRQLIDKQKNGTYIYIYKYIINIEYNARLQEERAKDQAINKQLVALNKEDIAQEEIVQQNKRAKAKLEMDKIKDNLEQVKKDQEEIKQKELKEDKKAQYEMSLMLEKLEEERAQVKQKKEDIINARTKMAESVMKNQAKKEAELESGENKNIKQKLDQASKVEKVKVMKKKAEEYKVKAERDLQVIEKQSAEEKEKMENQKIAADWNVDIQNWKMEEEVKASYRRMQNEMNSMHIKAQITEKQKLKNLKKLDNLEFALNRELIDKMNREEENPEKKIGKD